VVALNEDDRSSGLSPSPLLRRYPVGCPNRVRLLASDSGATNRDDEPAAAFHAMEHPAGCGSRLRGDARASPRARSHLHFGWR